MKIDEMTSGFRIVKNTRHVGRTDGKLCPVRSEYFSGLLGPSRQVMPEGQAGAISRFALAHRGKLLVVVSDTHPILDDDEEEWEASPEA
uniref:hypothetical protein n=1 Tax=Cupriavidus necator TaxID=106590 RepID=UPI003F49A972